MREKAGTEAEVRFSDARIVGVGEGDVIERGIPRARATAAHSPPPPPKSKSERFEQAHPRCDAEGAALECAAHDTDHCRADARPGRRARKTSPRIADIHAEPGSGR